MDALKLYARFGIRGYVFDDPGFGVGIATKMYKTRRYISFNLDFWKWSVQFGWSLVPEGGDGGTYLL